MEHSLAKAVLAERAALAEPDDEDLLERDVRLARHEQRFTRLASEEAGLEQSADPTAEPPVDETRKPPDRALVAPDGARAQLHVGAVELAQIRRQKAKLHGPGSRASGPALVLAPQGVGDPVEHAVDEGARLVGTEGLRQFDRLVEDDR